MFIYLLLFVFFCRIKVSDSEIPSLHDTTKASEQSLVTLPDGGANGPWKNDGATLKPCWTKPVLGQ